MILIRRRPITGSHDTPWHLFESDDGETWTTSCTRYIDFADFANGDPIFVTCVRCRWALNLDHDNPATAHQGAA